MKKVIQGILGRNSENRWCLFDEGKALILVLRIGQHFQAEGNQENFSLIVRENHLETFTRPDIYQVFEKDLTGFTGKIFVDQ